MPTLNLELFKHIRDLEGIDTKQLLESAQCTERTLRRAVSGERVSTTTITGLGNALCMRPPGLIDASHAYCIGDLMRVDSHGSFSYHLKEPERDSQSPKSNEEVNLPISNQGEHLPLPVDQELIIEVARLPITGELLVGRDDELAVMDEAWQNPQINVLAIVAWGGTGKSAIVNRWLELIVDSGFNDTLRVLGWTFNSRGNDESVSSGDAFVQHALRFFGDSDPLAGSPWERGERLASLVRSTKSLIILDGLEAVQTPPVSGATAGSITDKGLHAFVREIAIFNPGLCIVTTRSEPTDILTWQGKSVSVHHLQSLRDEVGAELLSKLGVDGDPNALISAAKDFDGHPLALTLLGTFLRDVYKGNVDRRSEVELLEEDREQGGHARRVMASYEHWLSGTAELQLLRVLSFFIGRVQIEQIRAVFSGPSVLGLTDKLPVPGCSEWRRIVARLRSAQLLAPQLKHTESLDVHPLVQEYFADSTKEQMAGAWQELHSRLCDFYRSTAPKQPSTIEQMLPLFDAVVHGCHAGRHSEMLSKVFYKQIWRGQKAFSRYVLGAYDVELSALRGFFDQFWTVPSPSLSAPEQAFVLNEAASDLRAIGRLDEATMALEEALKRAVGDEDWDNAISRANNLCEVYLCVGRIKSAECVATQAMGLAKKLNEHPIPCIRARTNLGFVALMQGSIRKAETQFKKAECEIVQASNSDLRYAIDWDGFRYCEYLSDRARILAIDAKPGWKKRVLSCLLEAVERGRYMDSVTSRKAAYTRGLSAVALARSIGLANQLLGEVHSMPPIDEAVELATLGLNCFRHAGEREFVPLALNCRAMISIQSRRYEEATVDVREAEELSLRNGFQPLLVESYAVAAYLFLGLKNTKEARVYHCRAEELSSRIGFHRHRRWLQWLGCRFRG